MPALPATSPRVDDVRLGIAYTVASVFLFSFQNAIGKWLAQSYPIPMLVFFRSAMALAPSYMLVMRAGGVRVLRTNRLGATIVTLTGLYLLRHEAFRRTPPRPARHTRPIG